MSPGNGANGLYLEQEMAAPVVVDLCGGRAAVFSASRPGDSRPNQDGALCLELGAGRGVLAIADGAGGEAAGGRASALALRQVVARLKALADEPLREAILSGFDEANRKVIDLGVGAKTTLALVRLDAGTARYYHVGDSLALVVGQRGRRKLVTISHSPVGYAVEAGVISEREAIHHAQLHLVSNLVGSPDMRVEMSAPIPLGLRDTVLVASDGLSDNLHLDEIVATIRKGPLESAAARLAAKAAERMRGERTNLPSKPDDLTFLLWRAQRRASQAQ